LLYYEITGESIDSKKLEIIARRPFEVNKTKIHLLIAQTKLLNSKHVQHVNWLHDYNIAIVSILNEEVQLKIYKIEKYDMNNLDLVEKYVKIPLINKH
jgi:hypothetical protein